MKPGRCIVLALLLFGCTADTSGPVDGLRVSALVAPAAFRAGEPVNVTITITNQDDRVHRFSDGGCPDVFEVTAGDGPVIAPGGRVCTMELRPPRRLLPGRSFAFSYQWIGDARDAVQLAPGTYQLRGAVGVVSHGVLKSDPVTIQVLQ